MTASVVTITTRQAAEHAAMRIRRCTDNRLSSADVDTADSVSSVAKLLLLDAIQYNTMENLHSKTDKQTVSLI